MAPALRRRAVALLALAAGMALVSCKRAEGAAPKDDAPAAQTGAAPAPAAPQDTYVTIPGAGVEIAAPGDWPRKSRPGGWSIVVAPDKKAAFAFITFGRGEDPTSKIGQIAVAVEASGVSWESPKKAELGPDNLPATLAKGSCQYASGDGRISYATVDPGGDKQLLAVYVANMSAPAEVRKDAAAAFKSLRRKR